MHMMIKKNLFVLSIFLLPTFTNYADTFDKAPIAIVVGYTLAHEKESELLSMLLNLTSVIRKEESGYLFFGGLRPADSIELFCP